MTTIRHCSVLEFDSGACNQAVAPGITRPLPASDAPNFSDLISDFALKKACNPCDVTKYNLKMKAYHFFYTYITFLLNPKVSFILWFRFEDSFFWPRFICFYITNFSGRIISVFFLFFPDLIYIYICIIYMERAPFQFSAKGLKHLWQASEDFHRLVVAILATSNPGSSADIELTVQEILFRTMFSVFSELNMLQCDILLLK